MHESYATRATRQESDYQAIRVLSTAFYTARWEGKGEFYTGIRNGDNVALKVTTQTYTDSDGRVKASVSMSIQTLRNPGAWLSLYDDTNRLSDIAPMSELVSAALQATRLTREHERGYDIGDDSYAHWLESRDEYATGLGEIDGSGA